MKKRLFGAFLAMIFCFGGLISRLAVVSLDSTLGKKSEGQASYSVEIASMRGTIYDRDLIPLVNTVRSPIEGASAKLLKDYDAVSRIGDGHMAVHIIGTLDHEGRGASGLEAAYDTLLSSCGGTLSVRCLLDAAGNLLADAVPEIEDDGYDSGAGLVLTLDSDVQRIAERAAASVDKGAVVVMDVHSGDILALLSRPDFDPENMAVSLSDERSPFLNRAFSAYSVGSTFKLLVAAAALDLGITPERTFLCEGAVEVEELTFGCHRLAGHGELDMAQALEKSCNPYFITLALEAGGAALRNAAAAIGFGTAFEFAPGFRTAAGTLPDEAVLRSSAALSNFGFGQGELTATPIQLACLVSAFANGGSAVTPRLVLGTTQDGEHLSLETARYDNSRVFSTESAALVREMMTGVVENGSGKQAKPALGGAGGKTASAQTGQFDEEGRETVHAWFAGFYPADDPQYAIVVFVEGGESGSDTACPVFREIADGIAQLKGN